MHDNLRLPNICFDEEFKVVFIVFNLSYWIGEADIAKKDNIREFGSDLVTKYYIS